MSKRIPNKYYDGRRKCPICEEGQLNSMGANLYVCMMCGEEVGIDTLDRRWYQLVDGVPIPVGGENIEDSEENIEDEDSGDVL